MNSSFLRVVFALFLFVVLGFSFRRIDPDFIPLLPDSWPKPHYNFKKNPLNHAKIELGRTLFYDPILSLDSTISCASCHLSYSSFTHVDHNLSHGIRDSIGLRNSPVLVNLAWSKHFMWDGAVNHIDVQALAPISDAREMGEELNHVLLKLNKSETYQRLFEQAFGSSKITGEFLLKAIAQFQLTLISSNSKYDKVKRGELKFSEQELRGYKLFAQKCASCHTEPLFTNGEFECNGLPVDNGLKDWGRYRITQRSSDSLKFKVPTLRNIEYSYPYMHDGRFTTLTQVMDHYGQGIIKHANLSTDLQDDYSLNSVEKVDLIAFLLTLSDKEFMFNPQFAFPR